MPPLPHTADRIDSIERSILEGETAQFWLPLNKHSNVYTNAMQVKSGNGKLFGFSGYNSKATSQFIQCFDLTAAPGSGAVPFFILNVSGSSNFSADWTNIGRPFRSGLWIVNSSTGPTQTAGSADCWFDVQFI